MLSEDEIIDYLERLIRRKEEVKNVPRRLSR